MTDEQADEQTDRRTDGQTHMLSAMSPPLSWVDKNDNTEICRLAKSKFHTQILELWSQLHNMDPTHKQDILNEYLLYNKNIIVNRKMLAPCYFGNGCNKNVKIMDLYTQEGKILPQHWRNKLKGQNTTDPIIRKSNQPLVKINMLHGNQFTS